MATKISFCFHLLQAAKALLDTQGEKIEQIDDWRDSADKKLKQIKERMDELGPEVRHLIDKFTVHTCT